jgi:nucleotide-binding universal stress UspA family protein
MDADARAALSAHVSEQIQRVGVGDQWPLETVTGDPAATIAKISHDIGASLIIMGLGGHGLFDRLLGDETVLKVVRLGSGPVLAVAADFVGLPSRVLAAVDFSVSSGRALMVGTQLVRRGGEVHMAHVISRDAEPAGKSANSVTYRGTVSRALDRMLADVAHIEDVTFQRSVLTGDPAKELLELSHGMKADLIVTGTHGHNFLTRLLVGSVSTKLLREAHCSILIAPPEDAPGFEQELPEEHVRFAFYEWAERLEEFTRRNTGRKATLELITPDLGAKVLAKDALFLGAAFDQRDGGIHVTFGTPNGEGANAGANGKHVTHHIAGVTGVQMLHDRGGRDLFLRVAHESGQTLLTLER